MAVLEQHDELGLPWDDWADGRVHRLVKGRDFIQSADLLEQAAENAGRRLHKVPRTIKEIRFGNVFVWVQFVDFQITLGEPCPCGSNDLRRVTLVYAECASCKATVFLSKPRLRKESASRGAPAAGEEAMLLRLLLGEERSRPKPVPSAVSAIPVVSGEPIRAARDPRSDLTRLGGFTEVRLYADRKDGARERLYGHALGPGGRRCLLVVDVPLVDGERIGDTTYPGGWRHAVWSVPADPFGDLIRLELLARKEPDVYLEDPLADYPSVQVDASGDLPEPLPPPDRLSDFEEVSLAPIGKRRQTNVERLIGQGRTAAGETVMLFVRYRLRDGRRVDDPEHTAESLARVRSVPIEPFGAVIDVEALSSANPAGGRPRRRGLKRA